MRASDTTQQLPSCGHFLHGCLLTVWYCLLIQHNMQHFYMTQWLQSVGSMRNMWKPMLFSLKVLYRTSQQQQRHSRTNCFMWINQSKCLCCHGYVLSSWEQSVCRLCCKIEALVCFPAIDSGSSCVSPGTSDTMVSLLTLLSATHPPFHRSFCRTGQLSI